MKKDLFGFKGKLNIYAYDKNTNELLQKIEGDNKIVKGSFDIIYSIFSGVYSNTISKLVIGNGGILDSVVKEVNFTDHDLYSRVKETDVSEVVKETSDTSLTMTFKTIFEFEAGESYVISEAGLFDRNDVMFSRKCFTEFIVDDTINLVFEWSIIFSPVDEVVV